MEKKVAFRAEKRQKMGFWGFQVCTKTLCNFTICLR